MLCIPFMIFILGSFPFVESSLLIKYAICPLIVWSLILIGTTPLCLSGILRVDLTIPMVAFCSQFLVYMKNMPSFLYVAVFPYPRHMTGRIFFWISIPNIIPMTGSLSHIIKIVSEFEVCYSKMECCHSQGHHWWSICHIQLGCGCLYRSFELISIIWYVEYLMRDIADPESIRSL